jgi:hypothetical protein
LRAGLLVEPVLLAVVLFVVVAMFGGQPLSRASQSNNISSKCRWDR